MVNRLLQVLGRDGVSGWFALHSSQRPNVSMSAGISPGQQSLACLVLGMEVPTTAAYVICVSVAGPALCQQIAKTSCHAHLGQPTPPAAHK